MQIMNKIITDLSYLNSPSKRKLIKLARQLNSQYGLEIGGPSSIFRVKGIFPVYVYAKNIDGVNFSDNTIWEGKLEAGNTYNYFNHFYGYQYIAEATDLHMIETNKYDFLLSSHSLEHTANPIKALKEWNRVLKNNGKIVLVLPDKENTFDNKRPYTLVEHLLDDFKNDVKEDDQTHIEEILQLHDHSRDNTADKVKFEERLKDNLVHRSAHHHVFSLPLISQILEFVGFKILYQQKSKPFHLVTIAQKTNVS
jgi:ubiquinone/menaquinone biosynthesis C-methylase UbiE